MAAGGLSNLEAVARPQGGFDLAGLGAGGDTYVQANLDGGRCWAPATRLGAHDLRDSAFVRNADGRGEVFALGADRVLYHTWQDGERGQWQPWFGLPGDFAFALDAVRDRQGRLHAVTLRTDGLAVDRYQDSAGSGAFDSILLGGPKLRALSASSSAGGRSGLAGITQDGGAIVFWRLADSGRSWGGPIGLAGHDLVQAEAAFNADGRAEVFALGADGLLYHRWEEGVSGPFVEWQPFAGPAVRQFTVATDRSGVLHAFALRTDGSVWHARQNGPNAGWLDWEPLYGTELATLTSAVDANGRIALFAQNGAGLAYSTAQEVPGGAYGAWERASGCTEQPVPHLDLARHWAPVVSQDIDTANVRADLVTRVDYDGNWIGDDNWNNLSCCDLLPAAYWWVLEAPDRYFIGYVYFHPRDWTSRDVFDSEDNLKTEQHENDLEGVVMSVRRVPGERYGRFEALITVAHGPLFTFLDDDRDAADLPLDPEIDAQRLQAGQDDLDGDVDFVRDDLGLHPVLYMQAEGHGMYAEPRVGPHPHNWVTDYPPVFNANRLTDWRGSAFAGVTGLPVSTVPNQYHDPDGWGDGIVYHLELAPDNFAPAGRSDLPTQFQLVGYQLRSISELFWRRMDFRDACGVVPGAEPCGGSRTFDAYGDFAGRNAQAPWGWGGNIGGLSRDVFFADPATLFATYLKGWTVAPTLPCDYLRNSIDAPAGCPR
jgi:hypothetical protein